MILTDLPPVVMDLVWRHRRELLLPWREALRQSAQATVRYERGPESSYRPTSVSCGC